MPYRSNLTAGFSGLAKDLIDAEKNANSTGPLSSTAKGWSAAVTGLRAAYDLISHGAIVQGRTAFDAAVKLARYATTKEGLANLVSAVAPGLSQARNAFEAFTGESAITHAKLTALQRATAAAFIALEMSPTGITTLAEALEKGR